MNIVELYTSVPVEEHKNIVVAGDWVYVRTPEGTEEYVLLGGGEMELVRSDKASPLAAIRQDLDKIRAKLGA